MLTASPWKLTAETDTYSGSEHDSYVEYEECELDDADKYNDDLTLDFIQGGVICEDDEDVDYESVPWYFTESQDSITTNGEEFFEIISLNSTTLVLKNELNTDGVEHVYVMTYMAQ